MAKDNGKQVDNNSPKQPLEGIKAKDLPSQNLDKKKLKEWLDESFRDVDGYDKKQLDIVDRVVTGGGLAGLEVMALPSGVAYTAGASMWLLMAMIFQIALAATDKKLAESFDKSKTVKFINDACNNGINATNFLFENIFNNLANKGYVGESFPVEKVQAKMKEVKRVAQDAHDETNADRFKTQTMNQSESPSH